MAGSRGGPPAARHPPGARSQGGALDAGAPTIAIRGIAAIDFFTVEVLPPSGLVRYFVLFVIDLESRRVHIAGIVRQPHGAWMLQVARSLTDAVDGFLRDKRYLIHDRDPLFTEAFRAVFRAAGVECLQLPPLSPNLNAFAERFVLAIKSECLGKLAPSMSVTAASQSPSSSITTISSATTKVSTAGRSRRPRRPTRTLILLRRSRVANASAAS